jgi:hypothetical protein
MVRPLRRALPILRNALPLNRVSFILIQESRAGFQFEYNNPGKTIRHIPRPTRSGASGRQKSSGGWPHSFDRRPLCSGPTTVHCQDPKDPLDPNAKATRSPASTWNVSKKLSDGWADAIASDTVAGVFGHLYDSHKEIYRQPYTWSNVTDHKTGMAKLYIAPPLSVNNQDTSPIQARGFALAGLKPDSIKYTIYWYDSEHKDFAPDKADENARPNRLRAPSTWEVIKNGVARIVCCAWQYLCPTSIEQAATLFIALLAAFLTIVQVWQIPPAANLLRAAVLPPAPTNPTPQAGVNQPSGVQPAAKSAFDPSPFASNFGKTVITGLGGLLAETALKSFEGDTAKAGDKQFYIVWFILLFFALLISSALLRAFVEAVRARIAIIHYPLVRPTSP